MFVPPPDARERPMASSSSMKMMAGAAALACWKRSRTREAPTPTIISTNSEADIWKNGTPASPATARASSVLPVPGCPLSSTPRGMRPPRRTYLSGFLRKSTISVSSALASSMPATSLNVTCCSAPSTRRARERPNDISPPAPPPWAARRKTHTMSSRNSSVGPKPNIRLARNDGPPLVEWAVIVMLYFWTSSANSCGLGRERRDLGREVDRGGRVRGCSVGYLIACLSVPWIEEPVVLRSSSRCLRLTWPGTSGCRGS